MAYDTSEPITLKQAYRILDVPESASLDAIKQSYRKAARLYHPDLKTALSDADKFHQVTVAYNLITRARKNQQGRTGARFMNFGFMGKKDDDDRRSASTLTYDELVRRFDRANNIWSQIEAAHALLERYTGRFEGFAIPRLRRAQEKVGAELILMLGRVGSRRSLTAIAPYLTSRHPELAVAAFVALDGAGRRGAEIIDQQLQTPSAMMYRISGIFRRNDRERELARDGAISADKMRRLSAAMRRTGVPLDAFLEGMGLTVARSA